MEKNKYNIDYRKNKDVIYRINKIFKSNGSQKDEEHLIWQYIKPINGSITCFSVYDDGSDAAVYSVFKVKAKINNSIGFAFQSLDTLTDEKHRGKGLFGKLANAVYEQCELNENNIVYGFPNSSSGPVFFNKLGWNNMGTPPFVIYINNLLFPLVYLTKQKIFIANYLYKAYLKFSLSKLLKRKKYLLNDNDEFGKDYDNLWEIFSININTTIWRDSHYMNWRFKDKPNKKYKYISLFNESTLIGKAIYIVEKKHNGKIGYIMDVIYNPAYEFSDEILLKHATIEMIKEKVDVILAWVPKNHSLYNIYKKTKFLKLPKKLQPIKLFFGYKKGKNSNININQTDFFISYSDSDTV